MSADHVISVVKRRL